MTKFFVGLYNYFERHKVLFYLSLSVCILFMALFAAQVRFEENVTSFFPDTKDSQNAINVFENLKIKDKNYDHAVRQGRCGGCGFPD